MSARPRGTCAICAALSLLWFVLGGSPAAADAGRELVLLEASAEVTLSLTRRVGRPLRRSWPISPARAAFQPVSHFPCAWYCSTTNKSGLVLQFADSSRRALTAPREMSRLSPELAASQIASIVRAFVLARLEMSVEAGEPARAQDTEVADSEDTRAPAVVEAAKAPAPPLGPPAEKRAAPEGATAPAPPPRTADPLAATAAATEVVARAPTAQPSFHAGGAFPWRVRLAIAYTGTSYSSRLRWWSGLRAEAFVRVFRPVYLGGGYAYHPPADLSFANASLLLRAHDLNLLIGAAQTWRVLGLGANVGWALRHLQRRTTDSAEPLSPTAQSTRFSHALTLRVHLRVGVPQLPRLALYLAPALEVAPERGRPRGGRRPRNQSAFDSTLVRKAGCRGQLRFFLDFLPPEITGQPLPSKEFPSPPCQVGPCTKRTTAKLTCSWRSMHSSMPKPATVSHSAYARGCSGLRPRSYGMARTPRMRPRRPCSTFCAPRRPFAAKAELETWADRIAVRAAIRLARVRRLAAVRCPGDLQPDEFPGLEPGSSLAESLPRALQTYLDELPETRRTVLVLRHALGYSVQENRRADWGLAKHSQGQTAGRTRASQEDGAQGCWCDTRCRVSPWSKIMNEPCMRFAELTDREALEEVLDGHERAFVASPRAECALCNAEANVWQELGTLLKDAPAVKTPEKERAPRAPVRPGWYAVALGAAAACGLLLWLGVTPQQHASPFSSSPRPQTDTVPDEPRAPSNPRAFSAHVTEVRGELEVDGRVARAGDRLAVGSLIAARGRPACFYVEPSVRACLDAGGLMRVAELNSERRRLELLLGKLVSELEPQPHGGSFGVMTQQGAAIAVGTAFSVEVPTGGRDAITRVLHGTVLVRGRSGHEAHVVAHQAATMESEPHALEPLEEAQERALLSAFGSRAEPPASTAPTLDSHASEHASIQRLPTSSARAPESASELLALASTQLRRGQKRAAVASYRALFEHHAASREAHAARIPFGELLLSSPGEEAHALAAFERYLDRGGALSEEASFGRLRALRALGRSEQERAALSGFARDYPASPLLPSVRARMRALGPP